jgi:hypothetical protein
MAQHNHNQGLGYLDLKNMARTMAVIPKRSSVFTIRPA